MLTSAEDIMEQNLLAKLQLPKKGIHMHVKCALWGGGGRDDTPSIAFSTFSGENSYKKYRGFFY
jgi:hypothetical protein